MKRCLAVMLCTILIASLALTLTSCGKSDMKAIEKKGYFTCGITIYDPMNYYDADGNLIGFDTDFAKAVAAELGVEVRFQPIDWGSKYLELNSGSIDAIWNGFTRGNESDGTSRADYVDFSYDYLNNSQCVVMKADKAAQYTSLASLAGLAGAAEAGSAGEAIAKEASSNYTAVGSQLKTLMELKAGTIDFAVVDVLLANSLTGKGDYADLTPNTAITLEPEVYAIGFRKGSDLTARVNAAIVKLSENGTLAAIAEKYGLTNALIPNIGK
ncbi:MAG: transporter substrate-binding domain-containing protein [Eubacteriales bacterium]|nr:transporter substrate-binding domain-containing protein [Eubacteriales bacterium]